MKKILIDCLDDGYITVLIENGKLIEVLQDSKEGSLVGNIYMGIVKKIQTGFIFADIGNERQVFLDARDKREAVLFKDGKLTVKQGDALMLQIIKDADGGKCPNATCNIAYAGKYVVFSKTADCGKINISAKITDSKEILRLKELGREIVPEGFSLILRTQAADASHEEIQSEVNDLIAKFEEHDMWSNIKPPVVLHAEHPVVKALNYLNENADEIVVNNMQVYEILVKKFHDIKSKIRYFKSDIHIFDHFCIKTQLNKMKERKVWLKSGAFIVIQRTEACVVIDVNTAKSGTKNRENLKINMEAADEIAYQLRLRNLSGIIIIDFINMTSEEEVQKLTEHLQSALSHDKIPSFVAGMTSLGMMEMTRKKARNAFIAL